MTPTCPALACFAVKNGVVVESKPRKGDDKASLNLEYDVIIAPNDIEGALNVPRAPPDGVKVMRGASNESAVVNGNH